MIKKTLFGAWVGSLAAAIVAFMIAGVPIGEYADEIHGLILQAGPFAPLVFVVLYVVRGFMLFPASVFAVTAGFLFGPILGIVYSYIAEILSAIISYLVGKYFSPTHNGRLKRHISKFPWAEDFRAHGFVAILSMRLLFFPFDLVGYAAGMYRVSARDYIFATLLGTIPGLIAFVLAGVSLSDWRYLVLAGIFVVISFIIPKFFVKRSSVAAEVKGIRRSVR